jgi:uncharacterized protein YrrD
MQFKEGANVFTSDGQEVGDVDRVVLDPVTKDITHLVVRKGFLFTEDKVVPVELVDSATEERVVLKGVEDLEALPNFEETYYVRVTGTDKEVSRTPGYVRPYYWYPPAHINWWSATRYSVYPPPPYVLEVRRNIPEGTVPLKEGAHVIASDDGHVGDIERVFADPTEDRATHLLISKGLFLKERKVVPTSWIARVSEEEVHLAVGSNLLEDLPEYQEKL